MMARLVELRRHTDNDGDVLSDDGVAAALRIGAGLAGGYQVAASTGAQRATQTIGCLLAALGQPVPDGVVVEPGLRSGHEDRWRSLYQEAGSSELSAMRSVDPAFVDEEAATLGAALARVLERLQDGQRALAVGHSPTNEAAVLGLTGELVPPMSKGAGVLVTEDGGQYRVGALDP
jgi:Histidine phosphatase superfamily (branch 1)